MSAHAETTLSHRITEPLISAPHVLLAYAAFAIVVTVFDFVVLPCLAEAFRARLVPYTGWVASMPYAFSVFFSVSLIFQQQRRPLQRLGITFPLSLQIIYGLYQLSHLHSETFGNPYLTVSPWRAVWTILIPAIWLIVLHSPRMNRFCRQPHATTVA